jgi:hypothetical protein
MDNTEHNAAVTNQPSWDSSVCIAMGYRLDSRGSIHGRGKRFFLLQSIQTDSGAHSASYTMGTCGSLPLGKAAGG